MKSKHGRCRSRQRSTNSSAARPAARPAARTGSSRSIRPSRRPRCRQHWCSAMPRRWRRGCATIPSSRPSRADHRTGSRCSMCATRACTSPSPLAWQDWSRLRDGSARSGRIPTRNTTGTGTRSFRGRRCGVRSAPSGIFRSPSVLLEAGANPTDGVSMHIAGGGGNIEALELLHRYGVNVNGIPGGVPPLVHMMSGPRIQRARTGCSSMARTRTLPGARTMRRRCTSRRDDGMSPMVERLVQHGADVSRRRADGKTPHTLAELYGNADIGVWLLTHGANDELSARRSLCCCLRARRSRGRRSHAGGPARLRMELRPEHHVMLHRPAESGNATVLETMLACGFEPDARDKDNVTPLHRASMGGHPDAVRVLLKYGADVDAMDGMFSATAARLGRRGSKQHEARGSRLRRGRAGLDRCGLAPRVDTP